MGNTEYTQPVQQNHLSRSKVFKTLRTYKKQTLSTFTPRTQNHTSEMERIVSWDFHVRSAYT